MARYYPHLGLSGSTPPVYKGFVNYFPFLGISSQPSTFDGIVVDQQSYSVTTGTISFVKNYPLSFGTGYFNVVADDILKDMNMRFENGAFSVQHQNITLSKGIKFAVDVRTYSATYQSIGLLKNSSVPITNTTVSFIGLDIGLAKNKGLVVEHAAYSVTFRDIGKISAYALPISFAAYDVTPQPFVFISVGRLNFETGTFSIQPQDISFTTLGRVTFDVGTYTTSFNSYGLLHNKVLQIEPNNINVSARDFLLTKINPTLFTPSLVIWG